MDVSLNKGLDFLADNGLNLAAILPIRDLPVEIIEQLAAHGIDAHTYRRLVLLGHGGRRFWEVFSAAESEGDNPIDDFSTRLAATFAADFLPEANWLPIFPSALPLNLQQLGRLAGWSHPSPLGTGINVEYRRLVRLSCSLSHRRRVAGSCARNPASRRVSSARHATALAPALLTLRLTRINPTSRLASHIALRLSHPALTVAWPAWLVRMRLFIATRKSSYPTTISFPIARFNDIWVI